MIFLNNEYVCINKFLSRSYAKRRWKRVLKDQEVLKIGKDNPNQNLLSVFGIASTGALGVKHFISGERGLGNLLHAVRTYPLHFFSSFSNNYKVNIKYVSAGYGFTLFGGKCSKYGWRVYGCGINNDSQLGFQEKYSDMNGYKVLMQPMFVKLPSDLKTINHIGCGRSHSIVVGEIESINTTKQVVYLFGNNVFGQCGREIIENEIYSDSSIVNTIFFPKRIKQVECGETTTYLLAEDGSIYGCGCNYYGQLGMSNLTSVSSFTKIMGGLEKKKVKQISSRCNSVLALTEDGEVWGWGNNEYDVVFNNFDNSYVCNPVRLEMPETVKSVVQVSSGGSVSAVLDSEGQVHIWGMYNLGLGPNVQSTRIPELIPPSLFGGGMNAFDSKAAGVAQIACGPKYNAALTFAGSLFVWGENCVHKSKRQTFPTRLFMSINGKNLFMGADHTIIMGGHIA